MSRADPLDVSDSHEPRSVPYWMAVIPLFFIAVLLFTLIGIVHLVWWIDSVDGWKTTFFVSLGVFFAGKFIASFFSYRSMRRW